MKAKDSIKILAVDDEQVILNSIAKLCSAEGWDVTTAINVKSALEQLSKNSFHLILSDIMMPEKDGFEFLELLKERNISTPLVMTTGFSTVDNAVRSLYNGAIDFLPKPFTYDELISCVKRGLRFGQIKSGVNSTILSVQDSTIAYVPCPPKYNRLGYGAWCFLEAEGSVKIGVTDCMMRTMENINTLKLKNRDEEIIQGTGCCWFETEDELTHSLLSPLTGTIVEVNEHVALNPQLIEKDPYFKGWLYTIVPSDLEYESKKLVGCSSDRF